MAPVAIITTPNEAKAPDSVPRRIFESLPSIEIEVASFVPLGESAVPYFWVWGEVLCEFERVLEEYPTVSSVTRLEEVEGGALYRIEWDVDSPMIECIQRSDATLVKAHGRADRWKLTVWFESGTGASDLLQCCSDRDVPIDVDQLYPIAEETGDGAPLVTPRQREVLTTAYERGYFERPREITQTELARQLGISASAVGDRLRRGTANLIEQQLL